MKVYFISGLAADSRVFKHIQLPPGFEIVHLDWIAPETTETLSAYALRLAKKIDISEPFALVGLSMGGMMATEIAKIYKPVVTILLSSVPVNTQLPYYFRWAYRVRLHKLVPVSLLKTASLLKRGLTPDADDDKLILKQVIRDSDPAFIRWAMHAILSWKNEAIPQPFWHIHGAKDEILPLKYTKPTHTIDGGNHLMIMSKAAALNELLATLLRGETNRN
ncbi:MAG: alpha/beta hydrolase [Chitinophagaceae bacterium]|nr:MAG: alpha/beta hydrolase [Chitinophagaceae bacterium]